MARLDNEIGGWGLILAAWPFFTYIIAFTLSLYRLRLNSFLPMLGHPAEY